MVARASRKTVKMQDPGPDAAPADTEPVAPAPPARPSRLGPKPDMNAGKPAVLGVLAGLAFGILAVIVDTVVAKGAAEPGDVLLWLPAAVSILAILAGLLLSRRLGTVLLVAGITSACLLAALHPDPALWMHIVAIALPFVVLAMRLEPATRVVVALPCLVGLILAITTLLSGSDQQGTIAFAATMAFLFALWFLLPYESGWRRVPFLVHAVASVFILVALAVVVTASIATNGISLPDRDGERTGLGDGILGTLLTLVVLLAYPVVVRLAWRSPRAQAFLLPSVPLPRLGRHRADDVAA